MKMSRWLWVLGVALGLAVILGIGAVSPKTVIAARFPHVQWVDAATLSRMMKRAPEKGLTILDVRSDAEFEVSHLRGAHRADPDEPRIESFQIPYDATVVVYCAIGYRSAAIVEEIQRAGISRVYNLEGGIFAWANQGRPVYREGRRTKLVHPYNELWGRFLRTGLRAPLPQKP